MVRIFKDGKDSFMVQTTCLDVADFTAQLAESMGSVGGDEVERAIALKGILDCAMPIAFKLAGYKADSVTEQRTMVCGFVSPSESKLLASSGV